MHLGTGDQTVEQEAPQAGQFVRSSQIKQVEKLKLAIQIVAFQL